MDGSGPRRRYNSLAHEIAGSPEIYRAKVLSVDKVHWTVSVQGEYRNQVYEGIPIMPTYVTGDGCGQFFMPEVNSLVTICKPSTGSTPFILGGTSSPKQTDEGDPDEDPNDHRQNRPVLNEGDMMIACSGTARIILRKGGVLEIGASESAKRMYIPLTNIIREFSQNYIHETGSGKFSMLCRDDDESFGSGVTPAEYQLQVKEFCEDDLPIVDLRMGRVSAEDNQRIINSSLGEIVYSFNINNRHRVWIDKRGNVQHVSHGQTFESYVGPRFATHEKSLTQIVKGTLQCSYGLRHVGVSRTDSLKVGRDRTVTVGGKFTESIQGEVVRKTGPMTEDIGRVRRTVRGGLAETIVSGENITVGGPSTHSVGASYLESIGEQSRTLVANTRKQDVAWEVVVANGKARIHNTLGNNVFSVGPTQASATCKIIQKVSGALLIQSALGAVEIEINPKGVRLRTVGGEISLDNVGTVNLGPAGGRGNVVTTQTYPADYTTGAPILGSSSVRAGMKSPLPGPALPLSTFLPDKS